MDPQNDLRTIALAAATDFEVRQINAALGSSSGGGQKNGHLDRYNGTGGSERGCSTGSNKESNKENNKENNKRTHQGRSEGSFPDNDFPDNDFGLNPAAPSPLAHSFLTDRVAFTVTPVGISCRHLSVDWPGRSCSAIVSIGFAGALDPALQPGMCLLPELIVTSAQTSYKVDPDLHKMIAAKALPCIHDAPLLHTPRLLSSIADKHDAYKHSNCGSCDMESGILAELAQSLAIPFACVRVVLDPATAPLPHCIAGFANPEWSTADFLLANLRRPRELPAAAAIIKHTVTASRALRQVTKALTTRFVA